MSDFVTAVSGDIVQVEYFANKKKYISGGRRRRDDRSVEYRYGSESDESDTIYPGDGSYEHHNHEEEEELDPEEELKREQEFLKQFITFDINNENWENEIEYNYEKEDAVYEAMCNYDDGPRDDCNDDVCI